MIVLFPVILLLFVTGGQAIANHASYPLANNEYPWTYCSWNRSARSSLRVVQSTAYPFPGDSTAPDNGAPQSFHRRIDDATSRWSSTYANASVPKTMTRGGDGTTSEVLFQYRNPTNSGTLGQTYVQRDIDSGVQANVCPVQGGGKYTIIRTTIRIAKLNTWFTQDDPYRAAWEACGSNFSGYTCSKIDDFGGIAAHELGHTLAVGHANEVVNGNKRGCGTAIEPTMCSMARPHRSEWRTLETHDRDTLHKHVDLNR